MAVALFNEFLKSEWPNASSCAKPLAFSCVENIPRDKLVDEIKRRIAFPRIIGQGNAPLCGPAAFMFNVARHRPNDYARYALDLMTKGEAMLGNLLVKPSFACRQAKLGREIEPVDWVALASLRDSSNGMLNMSGPGSATAGITLASMLVEWFDKTGLFKSAGSQINYVFGSSVKTLMDASNYYSMGNAVCLLVRASIIDKVSGEVPINKIGRGTPKTLLGTPDHWIVLQSTIRVSGVGQVCWSPSTYSSEAFAKAKIEFSCYSWGATREANKRISNLTVEQFLPYFNGFVHVHL